MGQLLVIAPFHFLLSHIVLWSICDTVYCFYEECMLIQVVFFVSQVVAKLTPCHFKVGLSDIFTIALIAI